MLLVHPVLALLRKHFVQDLPNCKKKIMHETSSNPKDVSYEVAVTGSSQTWGPTSLSTAAPAWKLNVKTSNTFINLQQAVTRKPAFRKHTHVLEIFCFCNVVQTRLLMLWPSIFSFTVCMYNMAYK
jgi:hypothetical protein